MKKSLIVLFLISCFSIARSQTPNAISVPTNIVGTAFSPSIAAFSNGGTRTLVAAYTYVTAGGTNRTVAISTSTNGGSTWTVRTPSTSPLPFPNYGGIGSDHDIDNMDEAQVLWCGGSNLVLVVRAWSGGNEEGDRVEEQSGSIYTKVGIYEAVSTDGGTTWGTLSGGTLSAGWVACDESNTSHTTLECPHVAFRWNYGIYAYPYQESRTNSQNLGHIVWTKKVFTKSTNYTGVTCTIGHQEFPASDVSSFGNFISPVYYANSYPTLTGSFGISGPERASVAISPNGDVWLGYYRAQYHFSPIAATVAHFYEHNLTAGSGLDLTSSGVILPGTLDNTRGYNYAEEFQDVHSFNTWDLAQGPSIEVACKDPQFNCNPDYQIGLAFTTVSSFANPRRRISVKVANCPWGSGGSSLIFGDAISAQTDDNMRYFPVLKHAEATDNLLTYKVKEGVASGFNPSYFILAYMIGTTVSTTTFDGVRGRMEFSFDNSTFLDDATTPASTDIPSDGTSHNGCTKGNDYYGNKVDVTGFVGDLSLYPVWHRCKNAGTAEDIVTVEGSAFIIKPYLQGMPGNDPVAFPTSSNQITVSTVGWKIFEKFGFGLSAPSATATNTSITPSVSGLGSGTFGTWTWVPATVSPGFVQPAIGSSKGGLFYGVFVPNSTSQGFLNFSDQRKAVTAGNITFAVSEDGGAVYLNQSIGLSNTSPLFNAINWTERIQIESVGAGITQSNPSIGVYEQGQAENYVSVYDGSSFTGQGSIAVVWTEKQSVTPCDVGTTGTLVKIKMRVNEFDECAGHWSWGPVYTIVSYYHRDPSVTGELADKTTAVVAPIVTPVNTTIPSGFTAAPHSDCTSASPSGGQPFPGMPCYLLGWSVTWIGPQLTTGGTCHTGFDAECTQGTTGNHNMINTGLYSRNWMRVLTAASANTQITDNTNWGNWINVSALPQGGIITQPVLVPTAANGVFNDLLENIILNVTMSKFTQLYPPMGIETIGHVIEFPTITSSENKWRWPDDAATTNDNYREEIAFSTDGQVDGGSTGVRVWHTATKYQRTTPTAPTVYGDLIGQQRPLELQQTAVANNEQDRNPSITINSSGQIFVSWESMVRSTTDLDPDPATGHAGYWYSRIQIQNTPITAPTSFGVAGNVNWILERKIISGGTGFSGGAPIAEWPNWLRNPSVTGFPKTRSMNCKSGESNDAFLDEDFACVQLLYWNAHDNTIRARHYFELQQDQNGGAAGDLYFDLYGTSTAPVNEGVPAKEPPLTIDAGSTALLASGDFPITNAADQSMDALMNDTYATTSKGNTQLSHSPRQHSPKWWPGRFDPTIPGWIPSAKSNSTAGSPSTALELTNTVNLGALTANFFNYRYDAYKKAAPEKAADQDVEYRSEHLNTGLSENDFVFGGIRVGNENAMKNVAAAYAHDNPESATYRTTRDRVLSTNTFDWNSGEELCYERMLGSRPIVDEKLYSFKKNSSLVSYEIDLVKDDGIAIPLEVISGPNDDASGADSKRSHIINSGNSLRNVHLVCKNLGDPSGSEDYPKRTLNIIYKEDGPYDFLADTMMNFSGSQLAALPTGMQGISNVFPNPVLENEHRISFFMNEPEYEKVSVDIYDMLGRSFGSRVDLTTTGSWQYITMDTPKEAGAYLLRIVAGDRTTTYPIRIVR